MQLIADALDWLQEHHEEPGALLYHALVAYHSLQSHADGRRFLPHHW